MYNFRDLRVWSKNAERFIPYTSAQKQGVGTICCLVIKNVFRNVLTKHLLQSRQQ